jgi:TRAP-type mannitol/chloroaromatic compound transport system permease small subunit
MTDRDAVYAIAAIIGAAILAGIIFAAHPLVQRLSLAVDTLSMRVGQLFGWSIIVLTGVITYEVVARRFFRAPTNWGYDATYMLYGTLFMMAGAYALSRGNHVRGDFLYRNYPPRLQASFDLALFILFFFPAVAAMMIAGWHFFELSFQQGERSAFSPSGPIIWPFKFLIPVAGFLLLLQGLVEVVRCVRCIRDGAWPRRLSDVEELEQQILARAIALDGDTRTLEAEMRETGRIPGSNPPRN